MRPAASAAVAAVVVVLLGASPARGYEAMQGPTELISWNKEKAFGGYTLFAAHGKTYLIDMAGNVVHQWNVGTNPKLLADGHLLDASKDDPSGFGGFVEVDWDGKQVWSYTESRAGYSPHHDFIRVFNKKLNAYTTMYIANKTITNAQALAVGADPANAPYDKAQLDAIVEVDSTGTVVWEWWFLDHLIQDDNSAWPNYVGAGKTLADFPGRLDVNLPGRPLRSDWLHCNSFDYNEELDQVVINAVQGEFVVVDHGNTFVVGDPAASIAAAASSKGDFLYRFGDPARYKAGDAPSIPLNWTTASSGHKQIGGAHDIHWIRPGLPGAGRFLVYNNGQYMFELTNQSYAVEVDPYLDANGTNTGAYVDPPKAGYTVYEAPKDTHKPKKNVSKQITWSYGAKSGKMFSQIGGSAQRLPNGNTLICNDTEGHFVEVTSGTSPEVVWEYISPVIKGGVVKVMGDELPMTNSVFRAYRYAADDPKLAGKTLVSTGPITGSVVAGPDAGTVVPGPDAGSATSADAGSATSADAGSSQCVCDPQQQGGCQSATGRSDGSALVVGLIAFAAGLWIVRARRSGDRTN